MKPLQRLPTRNIGSHFPKYQEDFAAGRGTNSNTTINRVSTSCNEVVRNNLRGDHGVQFQRPQLVNRNAREDHRPRITINRKDHRRLRARGGEHLSQPSPIPVSPIRDSNVSNPTSVRSNGDRKQRLKGRIPSDPYFQLCRNRTLAGGTIYQLGKDYRATCILLKG